MNAALAREPGGDFVVVWQGYGSSGTDDWNDSIQGRRYASDGTPVAGEFQVNVYTTAQQRYPAVASDLNGNFVVVWASFGSAGSDKASYSIQLRRYGSDGNAIGAELQVNTYTTAHQRNPSVATHADGSFVVVWESDGSSGTDNLDYSIQAQRYTSDGSTIGAEFQVNSYTTLNQLGAAVATDPDGDFVVVWHSGASSGTDGSSYSVQAQRYSSNGTANGGELQVNTYTTDRQFHPDVATDGVGAFVVAWESDGSSGTDDSGYGVQARLFASDGAAIGAEFQVNTYTIFGQRDAAVARDPDGDFVVTWESSGSGGGDNLDTSVQAQRYASNGTPIGGEFQVNTFTISAQRNAAVATDSKADFVVAWEGPGDASLNTILAQRYEAGGVIGDLVWRDLDFDGLQDEGEPGVANVTVNLFDNLGTPVSSTLTKANGIFALGSPHGDHYLQFELPLDFSFTVINKLEDDTIDSDADVLTGTTDTVAVLRKTAHLDWDAGMANGLGDFVWYDADGDGFQDLGEPGIGSVLVSLYDELGVLLDSESTDATGFYSFPDLPPDRYLVGITLPPGASATLRDQGSDAVDSDIDTGTGLTPPIDLARGVLDRSWDAGLVGDPTSIFPLFMDGFESGSVSAWSTFSGVPEGWAVR